MARHFFSRVKGVRVSFVVICVCAVLAMLGIGGLGVAAYLRVDSENDLEAFAVELRDGLVTSCETNGNPLREAVQHQIREQIRQRETLDFARFFPDVPPAEIAQLLEDQTAADRETLKEIAPVACAELYPKP